MSGFKRPTIRKPGGAAPPPVAKPSYLAQVVAAPTKQLSKENIEKLKPAFLKALERRRKFKRQYTLSKLTTSLYNATAFIEVPDIVKTFKHLEKHKDSRITVVSLKGGRFEELARMNEKSHIPLKKGIPNQIGIGFTIDGKNNYVNIFKTGIIRFTGSSDDAKVISFIEEYTGPLDDIDYSNRSGQLMVNKTLDLQKFSTLLEKSVKGDKVLLDPRGHQLTLQLRLNEVIKVPIEPIRGRSVEKVSIQQSFESVEKSSKVFSITFFETGVIQFKGKMVGDLGTMVSIIRAALDDAQKGGVFTGTVGERIKKNVKEVKYKTRSSNPPDPPDSFEGKCQPGYYCRPNSQGFPTCYKIPTINDSSRKTVIDSYKGKTIPESVKEIFGIKDQTPSSAKVSIRFEKQDYLGRKVDVLKIGSRQCARMTEDELIEVARHHGIPGIKKGMGITKMCERIGQSIDKPLITKANFKVDDDEYFINGEHIRGAKRSNKKPNPGRKCVTLPVETLHRYARAMGIDPSGKSKAVICKAMQEKKVAAHAVVVVQPPPPEKNFKSIYRNDERSGFEKVKHYSKEWLGTNLEGLDNKQIRIALHPNRNPSHPNKSTFLFQEYESSKRAKKVIEKIRVKKIDVLLDQLELTGDMRRYVEEYAQEKKATLAQTKAFAEKLIATRKRLGQENVPRLAQSTNFEQM